MDIVFSQIFSITFQAFDLVVINNQQPFKWYNVPVNFENITNLHTQSNEMLKI